MASSIVAGLPGVPQGPMVDGSGVPTPIWLRFFQILLTRTGGSPGQASTVLDTISTTPLDLLIRGASQWQGEKISPVLDAITDDPGSLLLRAAESWIGLPPGDVNNTLRMGNSLPDWAFVDGQSFAEQDELKFFAGPTSGADAKPSFRQIESTDLVPIAGKFPGTVTNDNAPAGDVGEYKSSQASVTVTSNVATDITSLALTPGDWDVWANIGTAPAAGTTTSVILGWINTLSVTDPTPPNQGAYVQVQQTIAAGLGQDMSVGMRRISTAASITVYLSGATTFAVSTMGLYGFLGARRAR